MYLAARQTALGIDLASSVPYPSSCNCGWCFLISLLHIFGYITCFGLTANFQVYNLVRTPFEVTVIDQVSYLEMTRCAETCSVLNVSNKETRKHQAKLHVDG
jgi:hypothetical protein